MPVAIVRQLQSQFLREVSDISIQTFVDMRTCFRPLSRIPYDGVNFNIEVRDSRRPSKRRKLKNASLNASRPGGELTQRVKKSRRRSTDER